MTIGTAKIGWVRAALVALLAALLAGLSGCAAGPGARFEDRVGVPAEMTLPDGNVMRGELVGVKNGSFLMDTEVPKSEELVVVRSEGGRFVEEEGRVVGTAVEVRDFDVVVRRSVAPEAVRDLTVRTRAYFGWGTGIAAALAFALVLAIEDI